jgi:2-polyprenyl-3-methyl-5-hydroxy-6-metoxy-1,4-benzoquinol methylase
MAPNTGPGAGRFANEVAHGKRLAAGVGEEIWGWKTPAGRLRAERRAALILEGARVAPGSKILEIGCGAGLLTEKFARSGADIIAVDLSPELLDIARGRGLAGVRFLEKNFEDCDVEGPFDAVIGSSILHHLELERTWKKIFSLLKPGGRMSFAEPNMLNPQIYCERHFRRFFPEVSPDETAFVRFSLRRDLEKNGFTSVEIKPFDWLHPFTPPAMIPAVIGLGRVLEGVWPCREFSGSLWIRACRL